MGETAFSVPDVLDPLHCLVTAWSLEGRVPEALGINQNDHNKGSENRLENPPGRHEVSYHPAAVGLETDRQSKTEVGQALGPAL